MRKCTIHNCCAQLLHYLMEEQSIWFWFFIIPAAIAILYMRHQVFWGKRLYTRCPSCKETEPRLEEGIQNCSNCGYEFEVDDRGAASYTNPKSYLGLSIFLLIAGVVISYQLFIPEHEIYSYHQDSTVKNILNISVTLLCYGLAVLSFIKYFKEKK